MALWHKDMVRWRWAPGGTQLQRDYYTADASIREAFLGPAAHAVTDIEEEFGSTVAGEIATYESLTTMLEDSGWQMCEDSDAQVLAWRLPASRVSDAALVDDVCEYTTMEVVLPVWPEQADTHAVVEIWWAGLGADSTSIEWFSLLTDGNLDRIENYRHGDTVPELVHEPERAIRELLDARGWWRVTSPYAPRRDAQWWWPLSARKVPTAPPRRGPLRGVPVDDLVHVFATRLTYRLRADHQPAWQVTHDSDALFPGLLSTEELLSYLDAIERSRTSDPIGEYA